VSKFFTLTRFVIYSHIGLLKADEAKDGEWVHYREARDTIKALERQLKEAKEYMEEHDCLEDFNEWKNR